MFVSVYPSSDTYFNSVLKSILKIKNKKLLSKKSQSLQDYVVQKQSTGLAFRLADFLSDAGVRSPKLENLVIASKNGDLILKYATEIKGASVKKFQKAIIRYGTPWNIAMFGSFVPGANKEIIGDLIAKSDNGFACLIWIKYNKNCKISKYQEPILKSKSASAIFELSLKTKSKKLLLKIENLLVEIGKFSYIRRFAKNHLDTVNLEKLENAVILSGNVKEMKRWDEQFGSEKIKNLLLLC